VKSMTLLYTEKVQTISFFIFGQRHMGGKLKVRNGDNHIVFHVGKELPRDGSDILLVPGVQNAQGRGIYCSEKPLIKYAGGEHYRKPTNGVIPIFCIPLSGKWIFGKIPRFKPQDANLNVYNSNNRLILLRNLSSSDTFDSKTSQTLRYYSPNKVSFYEEKNICISGEFSKRLRENILSTEEAVSLLKEAGCPEENIDKETLATEIRVALKKQNVPLPEPFIETRNRQSEYLPPKELHPFQEASFR